MKNKSIATLSLSLIILSLSACLSPDEPLDHSGSLSTQGRITVSTESGGGLLPDTSTVTSTQAALDALSNEKSCTQSADCRVASLGYAPCGGPTRFFVYSSRSAKRQMLEWLVYRYNLNAYRDHLGNPGVGVCTALAPPVVSCNAGVCSTLVSNGIRDEDRTPESLKTELLQISQNRPCAQTSECYAQELGEKICGGPQEFIPASTSMPNRTRFLDLARIYNFKMHDLNRSLINQGVVGTCDLAMPPALSCRSGQCL